MPIRCHPGWHISTLPVADRADLVAGNLEKAMDTLLIYVSVPFHKTGDGTILLEDQACNGLRLWAENFSQVIVIIPLDQGPPPPNWVPVSQVGPSLSRIKFEIVPMAYRPDQFLRQYSPVRRRIRRLIEEADYMGFAFGGLFGDWGAVAAIEARRMGKSHYVWADRVESAVTREAAKSAPSWRRRFLSRLYHRPMAALERHLVRNAPLGLFHGRETYDHFAPFSPNPQIVHDIHVRKDDHLPVERRTEKIEVATAGPLKIVYVGRADPMKGPLDWVEAMKLLAEKGIDFRATWLGDGIELARMQQQVEAAGLGDRVSLPGFARDRTGVLASLRDAHVLAFCHKTPESPRCLIEALISATPIVGYEGAFASDLISGHGGGIMVPEQSPALLAHELAMLATDRPRLASLIGKAADDGEPFTDEGVFRHRSEMIRAHLSVPAVTS